MFESNEWFWATLIGVTAILLTVHFFRQKKERSPRRKVINNAHLFFTGVSILVVWGVFTMPYISPYSVNSITESEAPSHTIVVKNEDLVRAKTAQRQVNILLIFAGIFTFAGLSNLAKLQPPKDKKEETLVELGLNNT